MTGTPPVLLRARTEPALVDDLARDAADCADAGVAERLAFAAAWGRRLPLPGAGGTTARWELLATAGAVDLSVARSLEPHTDALAILAEAGQDDLAAESTTWGVFAAEAPGPGLRAHEVDGGWQLEGTKAWCSLAGELSHALVTAWVSDRARGLFAVALRDNAAARVEDVDWVSRGLTSVRSGPVTFTASPATAVGGPGWYLARDGFAWGGMGVAAVWYGAAVALTRRLSTTAARRRTDPITLMHLGAADVALSGARAALLEAAGAVDAGRAAGAAGALMALRVRGVVADAVERVLLHAGHALGPGPLTQEEEFARRVADLQVFVRQHHGERDSAALGESLLDSGADGAW